MENPSQVTSVQYTACISMVQGQPRCGRCRGRRCLFWFAVSLVLFSLIVRVLDFQQLPSADTNTMAAPAARQASADTNTLAAPAARQAAPSVSALLGTPSFTRANAQTRAVLRLTELDHPRQGGTRPPCLRKSVPWTPSAVLWKGPVGPPADCARRCEASGRCASWEWCGCDDSGPGCPGCILFTKPLHKLRVAHAKWVVGGRGEQCDVTRWTTCDTGATRPPLQHLVIRQDAPVQSNGSDDGNKLSVAAVHGSGLDLAELRAWGMLSRAAYAQLVGGGHAQRAELTRQLGSLLSHARAWRKCAEAGEPVLVLELELGGANNLTDTGREGGSSRASDLLGARDLVFLRATAAPSRVPPYALTPRAAHLLYAHLWTKYYDQVRGQYLQGTGAVGPSHRHLGVVLYAAQVCRQEGLRCSDSTGGPPPWPWAQTAAMHGAGGQVAYAPGRISASASATAPIPAPSPSPIPIPRVVHAPPFVLASLEPTLPGNWSGRALMQTRGGSWLAACLQLLATAGGVCVLQAGIRLPVHLDLLLDGVVRFVIGNGENVATSVLGRAPGASARFPRYMSDAQFAGALNRLREEITLTKVVFSPDIFWLESDPKASLGAAQPAVQLLRSPLLPIAARPGTGAFHKLGPVPRLLHFIQLGPRDLAPHTTRAVLSWLATHRTWRARMWTDADMHAFSLAPLVRAARKYAQKSDLLRYELLYRHGGLYVDSDIDAFRPVDEWVRGTSGVLCNEAPLGADMQKVSAISNGFIGVAQGHPIMRRALVRVQHASLNRAWINQDTGPFFWRAALDADIGSFRVIPSRIIFPIPYPKRALVREWDCYRRSCVSHFPVDTVGLHLWRTEGSWAADKGASSVGRSSQPPQAQPSQTRPRLQAVLARIREHNAKLG